MTRVLLGHLTSNGDCLYATTIARQIKADFPGCHLTWGISSLCEHVIRNNPHVDDTWVFPMRDWADMGSAWNAFEHEAWRRVGAGEFDHAFFTQISPNNFHNYDGTIRPSMFRNYPKALSVPVETVIELGDEERITADRWIDDNGIDDFDGLILFECSSKSGQSFLTPELAQEIALKVIERLPRMGVVLSTHLPLQIEHPNIRHGGALGMRETVLLTHRASMFVGCGSGLTVVATSARAKQGLPNIQILNASTSVYASFRHDFEHFGKDASHFLETVSTDTREIAAAIVSVYLEGIEAAKARFARPVSLDFAWYRQLITQQLLNRRQYVDAAQSLLVTTGRYGWNAELRKFATAHVEPFLEFDAMAGQPHRRRLIDRFRAGLADASRKSA
jgi:hypothetical protein